jgi:exodeoxyribonuclease V alpha subunit
VDLSLMHDLLTTVHTFNPRPRLLFMGDQNQLQSVSYGSVLKDMINSGVIDHIHLKKIFRQDSTTEESQYGITDLAMDVLKGHLPTVMTEFSSTNQLPRRISTQQVDLCRESRPSDIYNLLLKFYDEFKGNVQLLIPVKRGVIGTMDINELMHKHIFKTDDPKFVAGEKVVCTTNAYARDKETAAINIDMSIFNGETGTFQTWSGKGKMKIHISPPANKTIEVDAKIIEMGYALTVHKSQGSEYDNVIILVNKSYGQMLTRNLLYTAITRAKKKVVVIYDDIDVLHQCIKTKGAQRYSQLAHMIADAFET